MRKAVCATPPLLHADVHPKTKSKLLLNSQKPRSSREPVHVHWAANVFDKVLHDIQHGSVEIWEQLGQPHGTSNLTNPENRPMFSAGSVTFFAKFRNFESRAGHTSDKKCTLYRKTVRRDDKTCVRDTDTLKQNYVSPRYLVPSLQTLPACARFTKITV